MRIALVLKTGGEYEVKHAQALAFQLELFAPKHNVVVLSDVDVPGVTTIRLKHNWSGWWSKMELFRPDIKGDLLYFDLDTVIVGSLEDIVWTSRLTVCRDFYRNGVRRPEGLQSCMMYLPEEEREEVWRQWDPSKIQRYRKLGLGDQAFLENLWMDSADRWQDVVPGQVVSFKVDCNNRRAPDNARVVCYHGRPRPWTPEGKLNGH